MEHAPLAIILEDGSYAVSSINLDDGSVAAIDVANSDCCCGGGVACADLPETVKVTLGGTLDIRTKLTVEDPDFPDAFLYSIGRVVLPMSVFTATRQGQRYVSNINCSIDVSGYERRYWVNASGTNEVHGFPVRLYHVAIDFESLDPTDPLSPCVLKTITIACTSYFQINDGAVVEGSTGFYYNLHYRSLQRGVIGSHQAVGCSIEPDREYCTAASFISDNTGADCTIPPTRVLEPQSPTSLIVETLESSCVMPVILIEPYSGPPICQTTPFLYADRCDGAGDRIVVDVRDALDNGVSSPLYQGEIYRPTGDPATGPADTNVWVSGLCPSEPVLYRVYQKCGGSETVLVDETDKPAGAMTYLIGPDRYEPTTETLEGDPVAGVWSEDPCPTPTGFIWERCAGGNNGGFDIPTRARGPEHPGVMFGRAHFTFQDPSDAHPQCQIQYRIAYHKIPDDGGDYPFIPIAPHTGPCSALLPDITTRSGCQTNGSGDITPIDIFPDALSPTNPNQPDPLGPLRKYLGCPSCGDPGF